MSSDPTDTLRTPDAIEAFIAAAAETGDIVYQCDCELIARRARELWGIAAGETTGVRPPDATTGAGEGQIFAAASFDQGMAIRWSLTNAVLGCLLRHPRGRAAPKAERSHAQPVH